MKWGCESFKRKCEFGATLKNQSSNAEIVPSRDANSSESRMAEEKVLRKFEAEITEVGRGGSALFAVLCLRLGCRFKLLKYSMRFGVCEALFKHIEEVYREGFNTLVCAILFSIAWKELGTPPAGMLRRNPGLEAVFCPFEAFLWHTSAWVVSNTIDLQLYNTRFL